ncbi:MAG: TfoX/Sxy family protein [Humibacillus sp.]
MPPTPADDPARAELRRLLADHDEVELRPMFGTLAALVDGHVFAVALGGLIGVKLGPADLAELTAVPGSEPVMMGTRQMRPYRSLPPTLTDDERSAWLARSRSHVAGEYA